MQRFLVCIHDASPAFARETRVMLHDLAPLVGRRISLGVVPNWHRTWPLAAHPAYCRLIQDSSEELLLHGYFHQRQEGWSPTSFLAEGSDEMNGLDAGETQRVIERGQSVFTDVFGEPARGFLAPAWQRGHVRSVNARMLGLDHVLGFFTVASAAGETVRLATSTWDCGRWGWLGHVGHGLGWLRQSMRAGVPTLAIHPRDLDRGFWPAILRLTRELLDSGYEPATSAELLAAIPSGAPVIPSEGPVIPSEGPVIPSEGPVIPSEGRRPESRNRSHPGRGMPLYRDDRDSSTARPHSRALRSE